MVVISFSQTEWQLIVGIIWRVITAFIVWAVISNLTHAFTGSK
jgi:hypothetical protein